MEIILAIFFGTLFGFVLHRVGAADPDKITNMLQLKDLGLMKTILLAIGLASIILFLGLELGLISADHLSVKKMYLGVIIGGAILGVGWAVAGYCPGTGIVALGCGRKDALFFVLGGLAGAGLFMSQYESLENTSLFKNFLGGEVTLAANEATAALLPNINGLITAMIIGVLIITAAILLPEKLRK